MTTKNHDEISYASYTLDLNTINTSLVQCKIYNQQYAIYNYDSEFLCHDDVKHGQYRSVVLSYPDLETILSFSPPKSLSYDTFIGKYDEWSIIKDNVTCSDYIEGVMINLFYDKRVGEWEIATKSGVGGYYHYYPTTQNHPLLTIRRPADKISFREMFLDALGICPKDGTLCFANMGWFESLDRRFCYSFVLQHPENKITISISEPCVYLVAVYEIDNQTVIQIPPHEYEQWHIFLNNVNRVMFPQKHSITNYEALTLQFCSAHTNNLNPGLVFWNWSTGDRCVLENPVYREMKKMRTINTALHYQYLCVSRIDKLGDFYRYFPFFKKQCTQMGDLESRFVADLHETYLQVYVYQNIKLHNVSAKYINHVAELHRKYYLRFLGINGTRPKITKAVVRKYLQQLEPRDLLYALYYQRRLLNTPSK